MMMEPKQVRDECRKLAGEIGPSALVHASISSDHGDTRLIYLSVYKDGIIGHVTCSVHGEAWESVLSEARKKYAAYEADHRAGTIRNMALAIIKLTSENGECTDAALRTEGFSQQDLARYGAEAVADANTIASNGPFSIKPITAGVNAA